MAIDHKILLDSVKNNVDKVGSQGVDNYKKELYEAVIDIIGAEDEHLRIGTNIVQKITGIIEKTGEFYCKK